MWENLVIRILVLVWALANKFGRELFEFSLAPESLCAFFYYIMSVELFFKADCDLAEGACSTQRLTSNSPTFHNPPLLQDCCEYTII